MRKQKYKQHSSTCARTCTAPTTFLLLYIRPRNWMHKALHKQKHKGEYNKFDSTSSYHVFFSLHFCLHKSSTQAENLCWIQPRDPISYQRDCFQLWKHICLKTSLIYTQWLQVKWGKTVLVLVPSSGLSYKFS